MHFTLKVFWFVAGLTSLILGLIGVILPLLPTTPFLLLASACFMKASPRVNHWLITHPSLGPPIVEWQEKKTIKKSIKKKAFFLIILSFVISIALAPLLWVKIGLFCFAIVLLVCFSRIPTSE
ncbi:DUF454 family protein [Aliivibrio fischeri]|uniref:Inner membrane protein n=1 Tax=Aliivibrio fischeri TaxID=668 RepID=A0A6N3YZU9_ALIFS|nr:DUF454 family protein [Aliivibrio fischeri]MUK82496.1 DUF454 family protein [Aliivibrio fischeri]MUK83096.1 DUF454 family protein [Aliivibrio fischeri]